jgi:hypothetical protein
VAPKRFAISTASSMTTAAGVCGSDLFLRRSRVEQQLHLTWRWRLFRKGRIEQLVERLPRLVQVASQIDSERDDGHEALAMVMPGQVSVLIPIVWGRELAAKITWTTRTRVLRVRWPAGAAKPTLAFDKPIKLAQPYADPATPSWQMTFRSPVERAICDCWQSVFGGERYTSRDEVFTCSGAYGAADDACVQRYYRTARSCPELLACTRRDP